MSFYSKLFRFTNLDICIGACINCFVIANILNVSLGLSVYLLLFISVWIIYTIDRILDTSKKQLKLLPRHEFHKRHRKVLLIISFLLVLFSIYLLTKIDFRIVMAGSLLLLLVVIYLVFIWQGVSIPKEIFIAALYASGILLAPLALLEEINSTHGVLFAQYFTLAFVNLLIISWNEKEIDRSNSQPNITLNMKGSIKTLILFFAALFLISSFYSIQLYPWEVHIAFLIMWGIFGALVYFPNWFKEDDRYGIAADGAFLLPLIYFLL